MVYQGAGLIVFARAPEKGKVKTRLEDRFSHDQVLMVYRAMLRDVLELARGLQDQIPQISIFWTGDSCLLPPEEFVREFSTLQHFTQRGEDLGARMYQAMKEEFARGRRKVLLIGCDSPHLPPSFIFMALDLLETEDWVLGPSVDGGYYLIGTTRLLIEPFQQIEWGTAEVLEQSLALLGSKGLKVGLLPHWFDLDRTEDLKNFLEECSEAQAAPNLQAVLRGIWGGKL